MKAINPATGELIKEYREHTQSEVESTISSVHSAQPTWAKTAYSERQRLMKRAAHALRSSKESLARTITEEMGKIIIESRAEIEKCAWVCDFYADNAEKFLADEIIASDASRSFVAFEPLGVVLAVMPWNFPFWQVFRFAAPALMAGNAGVLKHASNVPGCAVAIEKVFHEAGFPREVFRTLLVSSSTVEAMVRNPKIAAVTLTGSEPAGMSVASLAGSQIKKTVLELGGSDPFIVLADADLAACVKTAVTARMINQGQSCIAAKRFIVVESIKEEFTSKLTAAMSTLKIGDPIKDDTQVGPMARLDLLEELDAQVQESARLGAKIHCGGKRADRPGAYYLPTVMSDVRKGMPEYHEETFGPVAAIISVGDVEEAIAVANDSEFGLSGAVWSGSTSTAEMVARRVQTGAMFINGLPKSDPRLPFGGIKKSGYGRELSHYGIREFVNIKTIWIA